MLPPDRMSTGAMGAARERSTLLADSFRLAMKFRVANRVLIAQRCRDSLRYTNPDRKIDVLLQAGGASVVHMPCSIPGRIIIKTTHSGDSCHV